VLQVLLLLLLLSHCSAATVAAAAAAIAGCRWFALQVRQLRHELHATKQMRLIF
jgi:hypothetical protein